jgi:hypothetical protein
MFLLETALWIIDIHTAIAEISFTLTPSTDQPFKLRLLHFYGLSGGEVIAAVYSFMVRWTGPVRAPCTKRLSSEQSRRYHHHMASACLLVAWEGASCPPGPNITPIGII